MLTHVDENTGRTIHQLTTCERGAQVPYFRLPRHLPDGRTLAYSAHDGGNLIAVDPDSGDVEFLAGGPGALLRMRESDGLAWFYDAGTRELWSRMLPGGEPQRVGCVNPDLKGDVQDITCDGRALIGATSECEPSDVNWIFSGEYPYFWRWIYRQRSAVLWTYDLETGEHREIVQMPGYNVQHVDPSPVDPGLFKYAQDGLAVFDQRIHAVRTDGSEWRKIRPQAPGEWVHHEFWWPGGQWIGYKYMDRRGDATVHEAPWGEYAPRPLQLGIANLAGEEIYCSDPLEHYHSHLHISPDCRVVTGEGTHDYSFACAAPFSVEETRIALQPLATIHTPYTPASAQGVETGITRDGRWALFNDTIDGAKQVCAVRVEF